MNIPSDNIIPEEDLRLKGEEWGFVNSDYINCDDNYLISSYGRLYNYKEKRFLTPIPNQHHLRVHVRSHDENGKGKDNTKSLHRIMMSGFSQ